MTNKCSLGWKTRYRLGYLRALIGNSKAHGVSGVPYAISQSEVVFLPGSQDRQLTANTHHRLVTFKGKSTQPKTSSPNLAEQNFSPSLPPPLPADTSYYFLLKTNRSYERFSLTRIQGHKSTFYTCVFSLKTCRRQSWFPHLCLTHYQYNKPEGNIIYVLFLHIPFSVLGNLSTALSLDDFLPSAKWE